MCSNKTSNLNISKSNKTFSSGHLWPRKIERSLLRPIPHPNGRAKTKSPSLTTYGGAMFKMEIVTFSFFIFLKGTLCIFKSVAFTMEAIITNRWRHNPRTRIQAVYAPWALCCHLLVAAWSKPRQVINIMGIQIIIKLVHVNPFFLWKLVH